jgi:hypothetical protein
VSAGSSGDAELGDAELLEELAQLLIAHLVELFLWSPISICRCRRPTSFIALD